MTSSSQLIRSGLWRWLQGAGLERFELLRAGHEWILRGTILTLTDAGPAEARYEVACDALWHTQRAQVSVLDSDGQRSLQISAVNGRWHENGRENKTVEGAIDIDLGWTPSTNTFPIRRLHLGIGQSSGPLVAAWVRFPELTLQPLSQDYLRISESVYRYSSRAGAFVAQISVDDAGLVIDYEGFWQREMRANESR
ncbi:MAG: putative glycolipid-binding domain-containing protein [Candidatus Angelobacter sp.]